MMRWVNSRRAISAVFSVLLLVIITCIAGIFLYNFVIGMLTNVTDSGSVEPFSLHIDNVNINDTCMTVYVGNSLKQEMFVAKVYINDVPRDILNSVGGRVLIAPSSTGIVYVKGPYVGGCSYNIKVIFNSGGSLLSIVRY
jgi:hypothetical protein